MKKRYIIGGGLLGLLVIGAIAGGGDNGAGGGKAAEAAQVARTEASAADISKAFQQNEAKAKLTYDGKPLRVTGVVNDIDLTIGDSPVIKLRGWGEQYGMGVNEDGKLTDVMLSGITNEVAATIDKGKSMSFDCEGVSEVMGSAQISDCTLVK